LKQGLAIVACTSWNIAQAGLKLAFFFLLFFQKLFVCLFVLAVLRFEFRALLSHLSHAHSPSLSPEF
jgi:hypothetical protein